MYSWEMTEGSSIKWRQLKPEEMYCLGGGQWLTRVCSEHHNRTVQSSCHDRVCLLYQEKNECLSQTEFPVCVPDNSWPEPGRSLTVFLLFVFLFLHTSSEFLSHALQVIGCSNFSHHWKPNFYGWLVRLLLQNRLGDRVTKSMTPLLGSTNVEVLIIYRWPSQTTQHEPRLSAEILEVFSTMFELQAQAEAETCSQEKYDCGSQNH